MKIKGYLFGIIVSFALAAFLAFLGVVFVTADNLGWGAVALLSYAVMIGGPLACVLLLTWIAYLVRDRGKVPGHIHALMFLPTLAAVLIVPVDDAVRQSRSDSFRKANPAIAETHVNLSGRAIGLDFREASLSSGGGAQSLEPASATLRGGASGFSSFTRYPGPRAATRDAFPYAGSRLKESATRYTYFNVDGTPAGTSLPLLHLPYPDIATLVSAYAYGEAALVVHQYFHYPDHVEVAPGLARFSGMTEDTMGSARIPGLAIFSVENYTPQTLVRLELNGQTQDLGGLARSLAGGPCDPPRGGTPAVLDLDQPVKVRWQTLEDAPRWHEAQALVPAFGPASKADPDKSLLRVRLYFLPDGTIAAERYREIRTRGELAIRATGVPAPAKAYSVCGGAYGNYNPQTVKLLPN